MDPHPIISSKKMGFSIFFRFACKFRLEMTLINHPLVNYLRGWLVQQRLQPVWNRLKGTSEIIWDRLLWRGLLWSRLHRWNLTHRIGSGRLQWNRLIWKLLIWHLLIGQLLIWYLLIWYLIWWLLWRCIRTSRGIVAIIRNSLLIFPNRHINHPFSLGLLYIPLPCVSTM